MPGTLSKGKGKAADMDLGDGGDGDDDDAGGKGEKKKKNTYKHLIKGIPGVFLFLFVLIFSTLAIFPRFLILFYTSLTGKHSLKKDDSLTKVMVVPPKQRMRIAHFDLRTQEEAFTVSLEGLKGVCSLHSLPITDFDFVSSVEYQHSCLRIGSGPGRSKKKGTFDSSLCDTI